MRQNVEKILYSNFLGRTSKKNTLYVFREDRPPPCWLSVLLGLQAGGAHKNDQMTCRIHYSCPVTLKENEDDQLIRRR